MTLSEAEVRRLRQQVNAKPDVLTLECDRCGRAVQTPRNLRLLPAMCHRSGEGGSGGGGWAGEWVMSARHRLDATSVTVVIEHERWQMHRDSLHCSQQAFFCAASVDSTCLGGTYEGRCFG